MKKRISIAIIVLLLAIGGVFAAGLFPVARANGAIIFFRDFRAYRGAFQNFQKNLASAPQYKGLELGFHDVAPAELDRSLLEELIVREVISGALLKEFGASAAREVSASLDNVLKDQDVNAITDVARSVYDLDFVEFRDMILLPETRASILRKYVEKAGKDYDPWLREHLRSADVKIYFYSYKWQDGRLVD